MAGCEWLLSEKNSTCCPSFLFSSPLITMIQCVIISHVTLCWVSSFQLLTTLQLTNFMSHSDCMIIWSCIIITSVWNGISSQIPALASICPICLTLLTQFVLCLSQCVTLMCRSIKSMMGCVVPCHIHPKVDYFPTTAHGEVFHFSTITNSMSR